MRHFAPLADEQRRRLFLHPPQDFTTADGPDVTGVGLGATLYCPATRPNLAHDVIRRAAEGVTSMVLCLEDAVPDHELDAAERNLIAQVEMLHDAGQPLPLLFVRVRRDDQVGMLVRELGAASEVITGIVAPKFDEDNGAAFLEAVVAASTDRTLLAMPVIEAVATAHLETRVDSLLGARRLIDKYRELVPAVRIGATDLSGVWGLRRGREHTIWDVRVVADVIGSVVNVFGRADGSGVVVTGPVREYYAGRGATQDLQNLVREVSLDRANGLLGKTVIHPSHVAAVHALSVVTAEDHADAVAVLATGAGGGANASQYGNKMNESKPHTAWAERTMLRARVFGVARDGISLTDLMTALP